MGRPSFQRFADPLIERLSVRRRRDSIVLADVEAADSDHTGVDRLDIVLEALSNADPRRYRRVTAQFRAIHLVAIGVYAGRYRHASRTCQLDRRLVMTQDPLEAAGSIVHEATHSRLMDRGIGYGAEMRSRVERACDQEQLRFLERAGVAPDTMEGYRARIGRAASTDMELLAGSQDILEALGLSRRVARLLTSPRRWWVRRHPLEVLPADDEGRASRRQVSRTRSE